MVQELLRGDENEPGLEGRWVKAGGSPRWEGRHGSDAGNCMNGLCLHRSEADCADRLGMELLQCQASGAPGGLWPPGEASGRQVPGPVHYNGEN